jgi:signal transduction histidine kinase
MTDTPCSNPWNVNPSQSPVPLPPATIHSLPAGRDTPREIRRKAAVLENVLLLRETLDAMPNMVAILDGSRQILVANRKLLHTLGASPGEVAGKRLGEALRCVRAKEGEDGCGTGAHCPMCGAAHAIAEGIKTNAHSIRECRILAQTTGEVVSLDLRVTTNPFVADGEAFILLAIEDICHEKRVAVLQRTFFHDVLNTAGCIQGYASYLSADSTADAEVSQRLSILACQLIEQIRSQRDLLWAESGELKTLPVPLKPNQILEELRQQYLKHLVAEKRGIVIDHAWAGSLTTDRHLLFRVLGNMIKNALEATPAGGTITLSCNDSIDTVVFTVCNPEIMSQEVQLQVFQRSFSTKSEAGRGIGTYSMRLFGERYLKGRVSFSSRSPDGTIFQLTLPKSSLPAD